MTDCSLAEYLDELAKSYTCKRKGWSILKNPPYFRYSQPDPVFYRDMNGNRYFILTPGPKNNGNNLKSWNSEKQSRVNQSYKYDIAIDKFIEIPIKKFPTPSIGCSHIIHPKQHKLYVIGGDLDNPFIATFEIINNKWKKHNKFNHEWDGNKFKPRLCYLNNSIYTIHQRTCFIWNDEKDAFIRIIPKSSVISINCIPRTNYKVLSSDSLYKLYVIGGRSTDIFEYDVLNGHWKRAKFKLPFSMNFIWNKKSNISVKMALYGNLMLIFSFDEQRIYYLELRSLSGLYDLYSIPHYVGSSDVKEMKFVGINFNFIHREYHYSPKVMITNDNHRVHFMNCKPENAAYHVSISLKELIPKYLVYQYDYLFVSGYINHQCDILEMEATTFPMGIVRMIALFYAAILRGFNRKHLKY